MKSPVTFRHLWKLCPQALEIDERCKEGGYLHTRGLNKAGNKFLKWDETRNGRRRINLRLVWRVRGGRRRRTCRGRCRRCILGDRNDVAHLTGEVEDHVPCDRFLDEADELRVVEGCRNKGKRVSPRHEKGACGVDRVKYVPFEGGGGVGEEKKDGRL
jgi:hypothetical protein